MRTPVIKLPMFDEMLSDLPTKILLCIFVAGLGPLCEELAFRGFLMPLLARTFGLVTGILGTALLFGLLHAPEYDYSWRHVILITTAGAVFGWVRARTDSTAASTFLHSTFNLTQLVGFFAQGQ
ncbi:MAG: CPBP family intramembrane metalloprotease [Acidobacteriaceae bacterium]|nr:CPBP family intramembrane metalloprotease [Acidobacteriaceae bacterium]